MMKLKYMAGVAIAAMAISSCDEDTQTVGHSLTDESDKLDLVTATFTVSTRTAIADSVLSLSNNCYFGKVRDPETGSDVTSEFTTQFHILEAFSLGSESRIALKDSEGRAMADSCDIILYLNTPFRVTDSLVAMKMRVHEMEKPVEEGQLYYSNFDPIARKLLRSDEGAINQGKLFTYLNLTDSASKRSSTSYLNNIRIPLSSTYKAKDGKTYNNYGTYLLRQYYDKASSYRNSYTFAHEVCPGFFFEITDGYGFHANVSNIGLRVFYTVPGDSVQNKTMLLAGTKEVLQTARITNDKEAIKKLASETTHTYLKSPAGLFTEVTLPVDEIKGYTDANGNSHANDSLIATKITFQRVNNLSSDDRMLGIPQRILMLEKDSLTSFFEKNKVPDSKTSYYTTFSSNYNTYTFTNISSLITSLWNNKQEGLKSDAQWVEKHPNWNKVLLVPITYTTSSSSSTIVNVEHDMSLSSTRLVGGPDNANDPIEMSVVYAKFKQ